MARRLLNGLTALSLLLLAALLVAWLRQPGHTSCFSTGLPGGRLLVVSADRRLEVALWRDWPAWEWPAFHDHLRHTAADFCGPLVSVTGRDGTSYTGRNLGLGVRRHDVVASYLADARGVPLWPERRPVPDPPLPSKLASYRQILVPYWVAFVAIALPPALRLGSGAARAARSRSRHRSGRCTACGYDLTGNVSGTCPECGEGKTPATTETPT